MRRLVAAAACVAAALPSFPAHAGMPSYVATVNSIYVNGDVRIVQGGTLTLLNLETIAHDVVSSDVENGLPLFQSTNVSGAGSTAVVERVELLGPGLWPFYCSLHETMRGTIEVLVPPAVTS